jgi:hypothetical protein
VVALALLVSGVGMSEAYESLSDLEAHFLQHGLEPLPGQSTVLLEHGLVGVLPGTPWPGDDKPYVLIVSSPPAKPTSVGVFVDIAREGVDFDGLSLPPLVAATGRHVIVAYLEDPEATGEEILPLAEVAAYVDLSALDGGSLHAFRIRSAASSPGWMRLIEQSNIPLGLDLEIEQAPDLTSHRIARYSAREIPGLQFEADAPSSPGASSVSFVSPAALACLIVAKVAHLKDPPAFERVERTATEKPESKRPYTGTIPGYTADVEGLLLEGVFPGGPAEKAGLQAGDVIVELAGTAIPDVYAYSDALDSLEIDVPVTVIFIRGGERRETTLTPRARE